MFTPSMFEHVLEFINYFEESHPLGSHPQCWNHWVSAAESYWKDCILNEMDWTSNERSAAIDAWNSILEYRKHVHSIAWDREMNGTLTPQLEEVGVDSWESLLKQSQVAQRTSEWYAEAKRVLTASECSKLYDTERAWSTLVLSKTAQPSATEPARRLACTRAEMSALDWGTCLESVVKLILTQQKGWRIQDLGRIHHPDGIPVAASPDGIIVDISTKKKSEKDSVGNLVEIKCPLSRKIDSNSIPFEYWCQMQLQMEVTGRPACEYVEMKFSLTAIDPANLPPPEELLGKRIALIYNSVSCQQSYVYEEPGVAWPPPLTEDESIQEQTVWNLLEQRHVRVYRDRAWFQSTLPRIYQFWEDVALARAGSWVAPPPIQRKKRAQVQEHACQIVDSPPSSPVALALPE